MIAADAAEIRFVPEPFGRDADTVRLSCRIASGGWRERTLPIRGGHVMVGCGGHGKIA